MCLISRNCVPHPAPEIGNVACITRDDMKMEMEDSLSRSRALVESNAETVRAEAL